ncbi:hypothetical protein GCM10009119_28950 [Algoriphagus jejuensis]|uniref:Uncharacterized protein n=1 Tax=Algoriphagus jejuensis TaxID=419934 RepID=A0ABN1N2T0_9BACT
MSLTVTWASYKIMQSQLNLNYNLSMPIFEINQNQKYNPNSGFYETNEITIEKVSGYGNNFHSNLISIIEFNLHDSLFNSKDIKYILYGYYETTFVGNNFSETHTGYKNNLKLLEFTRNMGEKLEDSLKFRYAFIKIINYLKIDYIDINNTKKTNYYNVDFNRTTLLDEDAEILFKEFGQMETKAKYIQLFDWKDSEGDSVLRRVVDDFYSVK